MLSLTFVGTRFPGGLSPRNDVVQAGFHLSGGAEGSESGFHLHQPHRHPKLKPKPCAKSLTSLAR